SVRTPGVFPDGMKAVWVSGSYPKPGQFVAVPEMIAPRVPLTSPSTPGANGDSTTLYRLRKWRAYRRASGGKGCVGDVFSPGTSDCGAGRSSIGHTGWPVTRSKTYRKACLPGRATALIALPP